MGVFSVVQMFFSPQCNFTIVLSELNKKMFASPTELALGLGLGLRVGVRVRVRVRFRV